jgi:hypothetical protein
MQIKNTSSPYLGEQYAKFHYFFMSILLWFIIIGT